MSRARRINGQTTRVPGGFVALPWSVLDSPAYQSLGHAARGLLIELARQYVRDNNGRLRAGRAYLLPRGWRSADVINRALRELLDRGFLHMTVQGHRPNKASWYAITWQTLDRLPGYDAGVIETFQRAAYLNWKPPPKNEGLRPRPGQRTPSIGPPDGLGAAPPAPANGTVVAPKAVVPCPPDGHHLDKPSEVQCPSKTRRESHSHQDRIAIARRVEKKTRTRIKKPRSVEPLVITRDDGLTVEREPLPPNW